jgi:hypothetical protein
MASGGFMRRNLISGAAAASLTGTLGLETARGDTGFQYRIRI